MNLEKARIWAIIDESVRRGDFMRWVRDGDGPERSGELLRWVRTAENDDDPSERPTAEDDVMDLCIEILVGPTVLRYPLWILINNYKHGAVALERRRS